MDDLPGSRKLMLEIELTARGALTGQLPRQLYIEVTNHCNSLCVSCPLTFDHFLPFEPKHHLTWEDFRRIVDQAPVLERVVLHGIGEPLLNKDLPRFVAHLKERGAYVLFNSNGVLLDERRGDALVAAGLDELRVSLDGVTPELYAKLRGIDKLPRIIANLRGFIARHGAGGVGQPGPKVSLWFVGMQENIHQLPDFVRLGADIGVPKSICNALSILATARASRKRRRWRLSSHSTARSTSNKPASSPRLRHWQVPMAWFSKLRAPRRRMKVSP
jgi:MoaA/NifB/PqqE/SkfB family radical SAM enzyme